MRQLVGEQCTHCRQRIGSDLDGRYCEACGCPVHAECVLAAAPGTQGGCCPSCHTPSAVLNEIAGQRQAVLDSLAVERKPTERVGPGGSWPGGACPKCGLINPPAAQRCDCGYDFLSGTIKESYLSSQGGRADEGSRFVGYGCLVLAPLLLLSGVLTAMRAALTVGDGAFAMGQMCGAVMPGLMALGVAAYLLRRSR